MFPWCATVTITLVASIQHRTVKSILSLTRLQSSLIRNSGDICTVDTCLGPNPTDCSNVRRSCDDDNVCTDDLYAIPVLFFSYYSFPFRCDSSATSVETSCVNTNKTCTPPNKCQVPDYCDKVLGCQFKDAPCPQPEDWCMQSVSCLLLLNTLLL